MDLTESNDFIEELRIFVQEKDGSLVLVIRSTRDLQEDVTIKKSPPKIPWPIFYRNAK